MWFSRLFKSSQRRKLRKKPNVAPMFRKVSTVPWTVLAVFGSLAAANAEDPKEPGGKKQITNSLGMTFIYCPSGSFTMGSAAAERAQFDDAAQVSVTISKGFYLGKTSVTQAQFKALMGATPWSGKEYVKEGDDYPATYVDWNDASFGVSPAFTTLLHKVVNAGLTRMALS
jgi:formylglycine-generating enzyme required for sulfatase activity